MNRNALAIVPIVAFIAVILFVGAAIAILTPTIADAKVRTKHIRLDAIGQGLPGAEAPPGPADPPAFGPNYVGCITTLNLANGAITHPKIAPHSVDQTQLTFAIHNGTNGAQLIKISMTHYVCSLSGLAESILVLSATITLFILVQYIVPQSYKVISLQFIEEFMEKSVCLYSSCTQLWKILV